VLTKDEKEEEEKERERDKPSFIDVPEKWNGNNIGK